MTSGEQLNEVITRSALAKRKSLHMPYILDIYGYNLVISEGIALGPTSLDRAFCASVKTQLL